MIEVERVSKTFGSTTALRDVSFRVPGGRITGFVGNNGAGKSTVMRAIMGLLETDTGRVIADRRTIDSAYRSDIGYMPEEQALYPEMPVRRQLLFFARIAGLRGPQARNRVDELLELLGLTERAADRVSTLSLGNRQRVQLISALVHPPRALVLDEPFSGMDPIAVDYMEHTLKTFAAQGIPVLFSSHQLDLVERLCDRVVIIADGSIVASEDLAVLLDSDSATFTISFDARTPFDGGGAVDDRIIHVSDDRRRLVVRASNTELSTTVRDLAGRYAVVGVEPTRSTLTEIYRERVAVGGAV